MLRVHIRPHFGLHTKVADVDFASIDALHRKITKAGHKHRANRVVAVCSKMFALAVRWKLGSDNPAKGVERNDETKRKRYLSGDELVRLTTALAKHPDRQAANIVRLLLLTGARRGEVLAAKWAVAGTLGCLQITWNQILEEIRPTKKERVWNYQRCTRTCSAPLRGHGGPKQFAEADSRQLRPGREAACGW
jgi:integrase